MKKRKTRNRHHQTERNWAGILCFACSCLQLPWRRLVLRKWLNISTYDSDYSADTDSDSDSDAEFSELPRRSLFKNVQPHAIWINPNDALPKLRRRKSETFRVQYINTKEIRICAATWNVGGRVPPDDLDLDGWLDIDEPADIYVIGFQEIIPLNAVNIFGAEDTRPVPVWENIIRETLSRVTPGINFKSYSDPPSPSKFKPSEDAPDVESEFTLESDNEFEEEIYPLNESNVLLENKDGTTIVENLDTPNPSVLNNYANLRNSVDQEQRQHIYSSKALEGSRYLRAEDFEANSEATNTQYINKLPRMLSETERIGLSWAEQPLHLLPQKVFERPASLKYTKLKSLRTCNSFKTNKVHSNKALSNLISLAKLDLKSIINQRRRCPYVRIVSKQLVGIFITIWVRRSLRRHIQNINVSTVGVGAMGYIGNKGSISVSMSIHQTLVCFVCTHLTSGEKRGDAIKRNADVQEIHKRTQFNSLADVGLPRRILDHERIIWLGDLNYRINLTYEQKRELISIKDWSMLSKWDQLIKELRKGRAFDGWSEGTLSFAPTYKYELNSDLYCGQDPGSGRRTPAWCDRILSYGSGMTLLSYRRSELKLSDHRPVTASYNVQVEVFSPRKLLRALTFTDAELESLNIST